MVEHCTRTASTGDMKHTFSLNLVISGVAVRLHKFLTLKAYGKM